MVDSRLLPFSTLQDLLVLSWSKWPTDRLLIFSCRYWGQIFLAKFFYVDTFIISCENNSWLVIYLGSILFFTTSLHFITFYGNPHKFGRFQFGRNMCVLEQCSCIYLYLYILFILFVMRIVITAVIIRRLQEFNIKF